MGLSLSGTHVILFIISVILASTVSGVLIAVTTDVSTSLSERGDRLQNQLDTDFEIINDPDHIPTSGSDYLFYLKNTGDIRIITTNETFQILVDGIIISEVKYKGQGGLFNIEATIEEFNEIGRWFKENDVQHLAARDNDISVNNFMIYFIRNEENCMAFKLAWM